jgi:hypothetical protein
MRSSLVVLSLVLAGAAVAAPRSTRLTPEQATIAALPATGPQRQCVQLREVRRTTPAGPRAIMFEVGAGRWLRNDLRTNCPANRDRILVIRSTIGSLCQGDFVDVVDPVSRIEYGTCSLGAYTPVDLPKGLKF